MRIDLIILSFKTKIRSSEYQRNLLGFGLLIIYFAVFLSRYISESFIVLDSILNIYHITIFSFFLKIFPFLLLTDLMVKVIFKNNSLYTPPFIQVRPILKKDWNFFITLCNVFTLWNFYFIILFLPYLFKFATIDEALAIVVLIGLGSILNNGICLWLENYLFRKNKVDAVGNLFNRLIKKSDKQEITMSPLRMEFIYLLRSKRLLLAIFLPSIVLLAGIFVNDEVPYIQILMILMLTLPTLTLGQHLLSIEANFFNGIWTKPIPLIQIMETKYNFYIIFTGIYSVILFPFVLLYHLNVFTFLSVVFYSIFIVNLLLFPIALYSKRLDLNSSTLFNNQGFSILPYIYVLILFGVSLIFFQFLYIKVVNERIPLLIIFMISIIFYLFRKWFLSIISSIFIRQRHKIMRRYMSS